MTEGPDAKRMRVGNYEAESVVDLMGAYYSKLFPFDIMSKWLSYGNDGKHPLSEDGFLKRREFCYTLDGDIFCRWVPISFCLLII